MDVQTQTHVIGNTNRGKKGRNRKGNGTGTKPGNTQDLPFVSICTPTFNRRPFIQTMFECFRNQTYPKSRIEWIIVDDGTDKIADLVEYSCIPQIKYFAMDKKMTLGAKRNYMHTKARGSIFVYFDDDDYYPPERISHAVETLTNNPTAMIAGTSEIHLYFKPLTADPAIVRTGAALDMMNEGRMVQFGPYPSTPNHCTAATFAFRREILEYCSYDPTESLAEEKAFLNDFSVPFVALDPLKTILVFAHDQNTFDKRTILQAPWSSVMQPVSLAVTDFIRTPREAHILRFFTSEVDSVLKTYLPGVVENKPDVMQHLARIRNQNQNQNHQQIIHTDSAGVQRVVSLAEIVESLKYVTKQYEETHQKYNLLKKQYDELYDIYKAKCNFFDGAL